MNKKLFISILFLFFCSIASAFEFKFENAPFSGNLEFNEEIKKAGVKEAAVIFYNLEEKFGVMETGKQPEAKIGVLEALKGEVFETTPQAICVKIAD